LIVKQEFEVFKFIQLLELTTRLGLLESKAVEELKLAMLVIVEVCLLLACFFLRDAFTQVPCLQA